MEADISVEDGYNYELTPGVLAVIRVRKGLSKDDKAKAIILGTAEADAWCFRKNSRRDYGDIVQRIKYSYNDETMHKILRAYAELKLVAFFNSPEAAKGLGGLPAEVKGAAEAMKKEYVEGRDKPGRSGWASRCTRAARSPATSRSAACCARSARTSARRRCRRALRRLGRPAVQGGQKAIEADEKLLILLTNMKELKDRVEFLNETNTVWAQEGSALIPEKAKGVKIDKAIGYGFFREDLGAGYNDLTFVFSAKLSATSSSGRSSTRCCSASC
jgi:hypothetical protein